MNVRPPFTSQGLFKLIPIRTLGVGLASATVVPYSGYAQTVVPLPPTDLGQTYILDGEGGPGALLEIVGSVSGADRVNDDRGRSLPGDPSLHVQTLVIHPIYTSTHRILGAFIGGDVIVPLVHLRIDAGRGLDDARSGVGDVSLSPFLQWVAPQGARNGVSVRVALQIVAPTGERQPTRIANLGGGAWQVSPYFAVTKRFATKWEISARLIYDHSGKAGGATEAEVTIPSSRPGDFIALNLATTRSIASAGRVGFGGYMLEQTKRSQIDGDDQGQLQQVFALGPLARWTFGKTFLLAAVYTEFGSRNRPQGFNANLRFQHFF